MDEAQIRTNTPVSKFLSRFRFAKRKSSAPARPIVPDKDWSEVDGIEPQDSLFPTLNPSSPEKSDINHKDYSARDLDLSPFEPSSVHQCDDADFQSIIRGIFIAGSTDREDFRDGGRSGTRSLSQFGGIDKAGKVDEVITYRRRTRTGGQKRKNPDDRALDSPQNLTTSQTDVADTFDLSSYNPGKVSGKPPRQTEGLGRAEILSTIKTWKRIAGPQKTVAPKRILGQYFLDLGQSDFSYSTCPTCGLFYARGQENDEKIHKTFHRNFTQGILFKGWQSERVASRLDDNGNRVIIVLAEDTHHQAKVREVTEIMESELGLTPGWLLQRSCKVYLFISSSKKIVGCLMAEPIKSAFRVVPAQCESSKEGGELGQCDLKEEKLSILKYEPLNPLGEVYTQLDRTISELPTTRNYMTNIKEQCSNEADGRLPPKVGPASSSEYAVYAPSSSCMPVSLATGDSKESIAKGEGGLPRVKQEPVSTRDRNNTPKITDFFAPKTRAVGSRAVCKSEWDVSDSKPDVKVEKDEESQHEIFVSGQNQQPDLMKRENGEKACPNHVSEAAQDKGKPMALERRTIGVQDGDCRKDTNHRTNVMIFGNIKFSREIASRKRRSKELTQDLGSAILCTKTPVPAVCGVRVIWVSHMERRKGIASHLLDAMRKTFCLGVVLEPSQFAFSQPTPEGRRFAARYCKTNEFLVYSTN